MRFPFIHIVILTGFFINTLGPLPLTQAQDVHLPAPGTMVQLSSPLNPPMLVGIKVYPDNPFRFDFILDKGDPDHSDQKQLKQETARLIKYFLASFTVPEKDLWVNLSPYEKDRIIPESFGLTEMGRDLLAEDYMLKQITASLIYPEGMIGREFWKRVYQEAAKKYGTVNIPVNTFNKVWIVPERAVVYENVKAGTAYVAASRLKVMLEQDYLSLQKHISSAQGISLTTSKQVGLLGANIVREIVIPQLTREVNEDRNFAPLRQVYNSLILAMWYKKRIKDSIFSQLYSNKNKVIGVSINDPQEKERIYQRYLKAFKMGAYNYIKEDVDRVTQRAIPRRYFSGGFIAAPIDSAMSIVDVKDIFVKGIRFLKPGQIFRAICMLRAVSPKNDKKPAEAKKIWELAKNLVIVHLIKSSRFPLLGFEKVMDQFDIKRRTAITSEFFISPDFIVRQPNRIKNEFGSFVPDSTEASVFVGGNLMGCLAVAMTDFSKEVFDSGKKIARVYLLAPYVYIFDDKLHESSLEEHLARLGKGEKAYFLTGIFGNKQRGYYIADKHMGSAKIEVILDGESQIGQKEKAKHKLVIEIVRADDPRLKVDSVLSGEGSQAMASIAAQQLVENEKGGIDLTPANFNLQSRRNDSGIIFHLDRAMFQKLQNSAGFVPVIVNFQPMKDLRVFLDT